MAQTAKLTKLLFPLETRKNMHARMLFEEAYEQVPEHKFKLHLTFEHSKVTHLATHLLRHIQSCLLFLKSISNKY